MFVEGTRGRYRKSSLNYPSLLYLNICLLRGDALENDESYDDDDDDDGDGGSAPLPPGLNANAQGRLVRQALTDFLANN